MSTRASRRKVGHHRPLPELCRGIDDRSLWASLVGCREFETRHTRRIDAVTFVSRKNPTLGYLFH